MKVDSFVLLTKIKDMVNTLNNDQLKDNYSLDSISEYEKTIQSLEEEARNHVRLEQQLKLYIESLQSRIDELERLNKEIQGQLNKSIDNKRPVENKKSKLKLKKANGKSLDNNNILQLNTNLLNVKNVKNVKLSTAKNTNVQKSSNCFLSDEISSLKNELGTIRNELIKKKRRLSDNDTMKYMLDPLVKDQEDKLTEDKENTKSLLQSNGHSKNSIRKHCYEKKVNTSHYSLDREVRDLSLPRSYQ